MAEVSLQPAILQDSVGRAADLTRGKTVKQGRKLGYRSYIMPSEFPFWCYYVTIALYMVFSVASLVIHFIHVYRLKKYSEPKPQNSSKGMSWSQNFYSNLKVMIEAVDVFDFMFQVWQLFDSKSDAFEWTLIAVAGIQVIFSFIPIAVDIWFEECVWLLKIYRSFLGMNFIFILVQTIDLFDSASGGLSVEIIEFICIVVLTIILIPLAELRNEDLDSKKFGQPAPPQGGGHPEQNQTAVTGQLSGQTDVTQEGDHQELTEFTKLLPDQTDTAIRSNRQTV